jgi:hypothetical protein
VPAAHAPTHTNGTDQIANATPVAAGLMPLADKAKLDTYASPAAVIAGNILFSTGVGTSVWGPNALHIDKVLNVGTGVDADYHTIHEAVDAAVVGGASSTDWWLINVYPGTYSEAKTTIPRGIVVSALESVRSSLCFVSAADPLDDLFIMEGGFLINLQISGVSDALHACVRSSITGRTSRVEQCRFYNCSNGIWVENGSIMLLPTLNVTIEGADQAVDRLLYLTGANTNVVASLIRVLVDASVLPLYQFPAVPVTIDPVRCAVHGENGAIFTGLACELEIAHNTANQAAIEAGSAAHVDFTSLTVRNCHVGVLINAGAGATMCHINAGNFRFNDSNWTVQNAAAQLFYNGSIGDHSLHTLVAGATECSVAQEITTASTHVFGPFDLEYATERMVELDAFVAERHSSVVGLGGVTITHVGALEVSVSGGVGWLHRPELPYDDSADVSWNHTHFPGLAINTTTYIFIDPDTGLLTSSTSAPAATALLLFQVLTDGADVRFMHAVWTNGLSRCKLLEDYLRTTRRVMLNTGLAVTAGTANLHMSRDGGSYYYGLLLESFPAAAPDFTFLYYYNAPLYGSILIPDPNPGARNHVDLTQYDSGGGGLGVLAANHYRSDTVFMTSDGIMSVILGATDHPAGGVGLAAAVAEAAAPAPLFLYPTVFVLAKVIVEGAVGVVQVVDLRTMATTTVAPGAADHNLLANLTAPNDAHTQYLLVSGARAMGGALSMGTNAITNCTTISGVDPADHHARHDPGGLDELTQGLPAPIQVGDAQAAGGAVSLANSAHVHACTPAVPVSVGTANAIGAAATFVHSDHVHAGLPRTAADFSTFPNKAVAVGADVLLIEDSAAAGAKKYTTVAGISTVPAAHAPSHTNGTDEIADATVALAGFMSAADKIKTDSLGSAVAAGAGQVLTANGAGISTFAANAALAHTVTGGAPLTGGGALSTNPVITIPAAAGPATNGYLSGADKAKLDTYATAAAAPANYILFGNGAGGSVWAPNAIHIGNVVTVGPGVDADYATIHDGVDAAVAGGASATDGWLVQVYPGTYVEAKTTVPTGVVVAALSSISSGLCFVSPTNPLDDLFVMTGGVLTNLRLSGVSDALHACVRCATTGVVSRVSQCTVATCSTGFWVENGAALLLTDETTLIDGPGQRVDRVLFATGVGTQVITSRFGVFVPDVAPLLALYAPLDPVRCAIHVEDGATLSGGLVSLTIAYNSVNQVAIEAGAGAVVEIQSAVVKSCYKGVIINAGVGATHISILAGIFELCDYNWDLQAASAVMFFSGVVDDHSKRLLVANATECSVMQESSTGITETFGPFALEYLTDRTIEVENFIAERHSSVVGEGGVTITDNGFLNVTVSAGHGWLHRPTAPSDDASDVTWGPWTNNLANNTTNYIYIDPVTLVVTQGVAAPSSDALLLFQVLTAGGVIRFMHAVWTDGLSRCKLLEDYLRATRTVMLNTGLAVTAGTTTHFMSRDAGSYYYGLLLESFPAAATDFAFTYFYGAGGASSLTPAGGNHVDLLQYAPAALAPMTAGYFRSDTVFITSDGKMSVVMGAAEHLLQANAVAEAAAGAPNFLYPTVFILAKVIVQQSVGAGPGVVQVVDLRTVATTTVAPGAADHNLLANLGPPNDAHLQYMNLSGVRPMAGDLAMGGQSITGVNLVDGVDVSAHHTRHDPGGLDEITQGLPAPIQVGDAQAQGGAISLANAAHVHACTPAVPVSVGTANAIGAAATFVHSDHVHSGLTRGAADFPVFPLKATPVAADVALIEDSGAAGAKKYTTVGGIAAVANALTRAANDFTTFAVKAAAAAADVLLIEDSGAAGAKKYVTVGTTALTRLAADFASFALKAAPTTADVMLIENAAAGGAKNYTTIAGIVANALTRLAGDFSTFPVKATPVSADVLLLEDSAAAGAKKYATVGSIAASASLFGQNYQTVIATGRTTTTNVAFQPKVTLTTPALTGTYRVGYVCVVDSAGNNHEVGVRLYNSTDAAVLGTARIIRNSTATPRPSTGGFAEVIFTGAAKTFILQWNSTDGATVVGCQDARVEFWRVS